MRFAIVTTFFPNSCNPHRAVFIKNLVDAMGKKCDVTVIAPIPFAPPIGKKDWSCLARIERQEIVNDIAVSHPRYMVIPKVELVSGVSYMLGVMWLLWKLKREMRGRIVVHVHCAYPDGVGAAMASKVLRIPYVITAHGSDINISARRGTLRWQIRWALKNAAAVIGVSSAICRKIAELAEKPLDRLMHVPCAGYDPKRFFRKDRALARMNVGLSLEGRVVLFVGNLVKIKGVDVLVRAWSGLQREGMLTPNDRLVIVGEGMLRNSLEKQAKEWCQIGSVIFTGAISHAAIADWMNAANLLCLPSYNEGTPNVIVEALACRIPVVSTAVGGIPEVIQEGINGLLVEPGNVEKLAEAIRAGLDVEWQGKKLEESVAGYTWENLAERNLQVLSEVAQGRFHVPVGP